VGGEVEAASHRWGPDGVHERFGLVEISIYFVSCCCNGLQTDLDDGLEEAMASDLACNHLCFFERLFLWLEVPILMNIYRFGHGLAQVI
jgi:hypothetical protein